MMSKAARSKNQNQSCVTCRFYQTAEAQTFPLCPSTAAFFQSHLSHFSLSHQAEPPSPSSFPPNERRLLSSGGVGGREGWWAAYLQQGLALLKWNSLVLSDRAMEVKEGRSSGGRRRGLATLCEAPLLRIWGAAPRCSSPDSFLHFHLLLSPHPLSLSSALFSHHRDWSVSGASTDLPGVSLMSCQVHGLQTREAQNTPLKTERMEPWWNMFNSPRIEEPACLECAESGSEH